MSFGDENPKGKAIAGNLLKSAGDSLARAVQEISDKRPHYLKHCVLLTFHSVALIFKAKLAQEHYLLIYDEPGVKKIDEDVRTVDFIESIARLKNCDVKFDAKEVEYLKKFQSYRNRAEHFLPDLKEQDVISHLGHVYQFIHYFLKEQLDVEILKFVGKKEGELLLQFAHDYDKKVKDIEAHWANTFGKIPAADLFTESCRRCGLPFHRFTKDMMGKTSACCFCGNKQEIDKCHFCPNPTIGGICDECDDAMAQAAYEQYLAEEESGT